MLSTSDVSIIHILDLCNARGEYTVRDWLESFSSPLNPDIESFLTDKAVDFSRGKLSVTYCVIDNSNASLLGYFTLTHKALEIDNDGLSGNFKKKLDRYGRYDPGRKSYTVSAFLLAQFGKNYAIDGSKRIDGKMLMKCAMNTAAQIQYLIGGGVIGYSVAAKPPVRQYGNLDSGQRRLS